MSSTCFSFLFLIKMTEIYKDDGVGLEDGNGVEFRVCGDGNSSSRHDGNYTIKCNSSRPPGIVRELFTLYYKSFDMHNK